MLFDSFHIIYIVVSLAITALLLFLLLKFAKSERAKHTAMAVIGVVTAFSHISSLWVNYLSNGSAGVADNMLFPIYFCNLFMYLLPVLSLIRNKSSKAYQALSLICAYGSLIGGFISLVYPDYYVASNGVMDYGLFKSFYSHSLLLLAGLYLFLGKFVSLRVGNFVTAIGGMASCLLIGLGVNVLFVACGLNSPNAMYLDNPPLADVPFLNIWVISLLVVIIAFTVGAIYEQKHFPLEKRWYKCKLQIFD